MIGNNRSLLFNVKKYLAIICIGALCVSAYACGDTASVNPEVQLASLTVTPGTLQPGFSGGTTQYTVNLSNNVSGVTVTAQPAVSGDSVSINGAMKRNESRSRFQCATAPNAASSRNATASARCTPA